MIRKTTTLIAILAMVLMAPLAVQAQNEEPYESRTQPNADAKGPVDGLTITGTVEEIRDGQVVINTTTGIQHIQVLPDTGVPVNLTEGDDVSIDYNRNTQGVMIATEIRLVETDVLETETAAVETDDAVAVVETDTESDFEREVETETAEFEREVETEAAEVERDFETADTEFDTGDELETDTTTTTTTTQSQLPSTASGLPLAALLSLLILGAAIAVRTFRS